jgi:hypothetical protein
LQPEILTHHWNGTGPPRRAIACARPNRARAKDLNMNTATDLTI